MLAPLFSGATAQCGPPGFDPGTDFHRDYNRVESGLPESLARKLLHLSLFLTHWPKSVQPGKVPATTPALPFRQPGVSGNTHFRPRPSPFFFLLPGAQRHVSEPDCAAWEPIHPGPVPGPAGRLKPGAPGGSTGPGPTPARRGRVKCSASGSWWSPGCRGLLGSNPIPRPGPA